MPQMNYQCLAFVTFYLFQLKKNLYSLSTKSPLYFHYLISLVATLITALSVIRSQCYCTFLWEWSHENSRGTCARETFRPLKNKNARTFSQRTLRRNMLFILILQTGKIVSQVPQNKFFGRRLVLLNVKFSQKAALIILSQDQTIV